MTVTLWLPCKGDFSKTYELPEGFELPQRLHITAFGDYLHSGNIEEGQFTMFNWVFVRLLDTTDYQFSHKERV